MLFFQANGEELMSPLFLKIINLSEVKNYRPISLLSVISKCMKRCVYKHVYNHLLQNDILTRNQSGFAKGDSAVNLLVNISNEFGNVLDNRKEIRVVFVISVRRLTEYGTKDYFSN